MEVFKLGELILELLEMVLGLWNSYIDLAMELLGQPVTSFKGGGAWSAIESLQPLFIGVGSSLIVLFFVMGFCSESIDVRQEMRLEGILRILIRLSVSEWLVVNSLTILKSFMASIGNLVTAIGGNQTTHVSLDGEAANIIRNLGFASSLVFLILAVVIALVIMVCAFFLLYTIYFRFLRLYVVLPFAPIAFSSFAGNHGISHTAIRYFKYFLSVALEAVTIVLAVVVCNAFISAGLPDFASGYSGWVKTLFILFEMTFTISLTVGAVKGAQNLTSRMLGL